MKEVLVYFVGWSSVLHKPSVEVPEARQGASSSGMGVAAKHCPIQAEPASLEQLPCFHVLSPPSSFEVLVTR